MDEALDAVGAVGTGVLLAREVERVHAPGHDTSRTCANCGTSLAGPFCSMCGQHGHVHRTAGALLHDLAHGVFHFEGKLWATLPMLAWRPGELTRRYVHGERAKFVSPMALFLFSVFLLFAVVSNLPGMKLGKGAFESRRADLLAVQAKLDEEQRRSVAEVARLERSLVSERAESSPDAEEVARIEKRLIDARQARQQLERAASLMPAPAAIGHAPEGGSWLDQRYRHAKENPELLFYKMKSSAYKWSWALIPLSLPFIWLLFPLRRDVGLYDHAIFATYSLSFMSLMAVALGILNSIGIPSAPLILAAIAIPLVHMYRQLKGAYELTRLGAIWRTWLLSWFITVIVPLFGLLLLYLGVAD